MIRLVLLAASMIAFAAAAATPVQPGNFSWRAPVDVPAGTALARVALPGDALVQSRSPGLADLRVFNARGEPVAFAVRRPDASAAPPTTTQRLPAYPMSRTPDAKAANGQQLQVRVAGAQGESVWVQLGGSAPAGDRLPSVLFDLRQEKRPIAALQLDAELPPNTPLPLTASTSADLAEWTPLPLRGSLFRFDGPPELENRTLALPSPQSFEGRYLRLEWTEQPGVRIDGLVAVLGNAPVRERVTAALPSPEPVAGGLEWRVDTAVPLAALALSTAQPGTLVPVRVLGRREPSQPWGELAQTVVFRLGSGAGEATNPPLPLGQAAPRWLRVEPLRGLPLGTLEARVEFEPVEVALLAAGGPLQLAIGRPDTPAGDVPASTLAAAVPGGRLQDLPLARLGAADVRAPSAAGAVGSWLPRDVAPTTVALWAVLLAGVLVLAVVAVRLLKQLQRPSPDGGA
jgi:hypothetical protein